MYRKNKLYGFCCQCFGLGLLVGCFLESWFFCSLAGLGLILFGMTLVKRR